MCNVCNLENLGNKLFNKIMQKVNVEREAFQYKGDYLPANFMIKRFSFSSFSMDRLHIKKPTGKI